MGSSVALRTVSRASLKSCRSCSVHMCLYCLYRLSLSSISLSSFSVNVHEPRSSFSIMVLTETNLVITSSKWVYEQLTRVSREESHLNTDQSHYLRWSQIKNVSADLKSWKVILQGAGGVIEDLIEANMRSCPSAKGTSVFQWSITMSFESTIQKSRALSDVDVW